MQILLIRDTNGCHCRRYGKLIILKFPNRPCFGKKKSTGLCNFFRASKFCLLPALWACDEKTSCEDCKKKAYVFYKHFLLHYSGSWRRVYGLCSNTVVPRPGAAGGGHVLWSACRYMGHRLRVCRAVDGAGIMAGQIRCGPALPDQENSRYGIEVFNHWM